MIVRWTPTALRDLESLHAYVADDNRNAAASTVAMVASGIDSLRRHPEMGRRGCVPGTRELVISPYIVAYRLSDVYVEVPVIIHAVRRWPDSF